MDEAVRGSGSETVGDSSSETDYSGSDTEDTYDEYNDEYNMYRDESDVEELVRSDDTRISQTTHLSQDYESSSYMRNADMSKESPPYYRWDPPSEEDAPYCQREPSQRPRLRGVSLLSSRPEPPVLYAPERGPPLLDFLFVLTAFLAAVFAAYYSMFTNM